MFKFDFFIGFLIEKIIGSIILNDFLDVVIRNFVQFVHISKKPAVYFLLFVFDLEQGGAPEHDCDFAFELEDPLVILKLSLLFQKAEFQKLFSEREDKAILVY